MKRTHREWRLTWTTKGKSKLRLGRNMLCSRHCSDDVGTSESHGPVTRVLRLTSNWQEEPAAT